MHGLLAALALVSEQLCEIKKIVDQVIFVRNDGKPIFCCSITGSGGAYMSSSIPQDALLTLPLHARSLSQQQGLMSAARLLTRSLAEQSDPLLAFLSVWFGLEIFVEKNFKEYEDRAHKRLTAGEPPVVPAVVAERIRAGNSGKYSLVEKFSVIATELSAPEIEKDQASFESIKKTRNRLLHGEDIPLSALPTTNAQRLLRKYIRLHLQRSR